MWQLRLPALPGRHEILAALGYRLGERMRYAFRHRPLTDNKLARRAAELAERAPLERFWKIYMELMTRSADLAEEALAAVAAELGLESPETAEPPNVQGPASRRMKRVRAPTALGARRRSS